MTGRSETYRPARQERANFQVACRLPLVGGPPARHDAACTSQERYLARRGHSALVMRTRAALYDTIQDVAA